EVKAGLALDVDRLRTRVRDQVPLFAALLPERGQPAPAAPAAAAAPPPARPVPAVFRAVPPTGPVRPVESEPKLVEGLTAELARRGLHFARDFVANVYSCLKAEPLNLLIGPPGHGKSMLVSSLARAMGHGDALLRIAVRRSWSEDRHLLGFYDSFHGRYDPGTSGLVPRMLQAQADWRNGRVGVYVVLLDEFNLAAPEYYFSQLLQALPSDDDSREVMLYDDAGEGAFPGRVTLGPNLRFWGTINYDETTERLSPRTLDRTGMIFLGPGDVRPAADDGQAAMPGVSAGDLFEKFLRGPDDCPEDRWEIVSRVLDFLHAPDPALGPRIGVSPRVRKALKRYLANSAAVLGPKQAADFAVQQRILPVVRGRGDEFLARMRRLGHLLAEASLPRSASHVEEALRRAEQQFGELDLFSY
ncbi:MAG: AAA family ATPase, partial [Gemmataceae bacterium]